MENFESPSSMNLSSRLTERNVLKELNSIEAATKSKKDLSEDPAVHSKDTNNLSNHLPDIVTNVNLDKAVNRNLLSVATTPDIQSSDDEFVDCNSAVKNDLSGVAVNKTIENVSKILDETIQILEKRKPTPNDANATVCVPDVKLNDEFIDITNSLSHQSKSETNTDTSPSNDLNYQGENIIQNQSKDTFISSQLTDIARTTSSTENTAVTSQSVCESVLSDAKSIDPTVGSNKLNESVDITSLFRRLEIAGDEQLIATTSTLNPNVSPTGTSEIDCENFNVPQSAHHNIYQKAQTKADVELSSLNQTQNLNNFVNAEDSSNCQQETTFMLTDNAINSTALLEWKLNEIAAATEAESLNAELKQVEKICTLKANQTVSVDSLDMDNEIQDSLLDSLESKQPINDQPSTPTKNILPNTVEKVFSSKKSPLLSELFPSSGHKDSIALPMTDSQRWMSLAGDNDELGNEISPNSFSPSDKITASGRIIRRGTFHISSPMDSNEESATSPSDDCFTDVAEKVFSSKKSPNISEMFPDSGRAVISTNNFPSQNMYSAALPVLCNDSDVPLVSNKNELQNENSPSKFSTSDKINCFELNHQGTFNSSISLDRNDKSTELSKDISNTDNPSINKVNETGESDFQFKKPSLPISPTGIRNNEQFSGGDGNFIVLNSIDFDFLQSRGANCIDPEDDPRSSLLLRFDPLAGRSVYKTHLASSAETGIQKDLQKTDFLTNSSGDNSTNEQHSLKKQSHATNASEMSVGLVHDSNNMDNDTNSNDDKHIAVDGVSLTDKKIKLEYTDGNIKKKMEEYEATQEILVKRLTEKEKTLSKNCAIIEAYEKALAELVAEKEKLTENYETINERLRNERDIHYQHLMSLENTFSDLHIVRIRNLEPRYPNQLYNQQQVNGALEYLARKYERSKEFTVQLQERLDLLTEEKAKIDELLKQQEARYEKMKQHALHQLEYANSTLEDQEKNNSRENSRLKALLKIEEVSRNTIQEQLLQKCKENEELVKICDELIGGQKS